MWWVVLIIDGNPLLVSCWYSLIYSSSSSSSSSSSLSSPTCWCTFSYSFQHCSTQKKQTLSYTLHKKTNIMRWQCLAFLRYLFLYGANSALICIKTYIMEGETVHLEGQYLNIVSTIAFVKLMFEQQETLQI